MSISFTYISSTIFLHVKKIKITNERISEQIKVTRKERLADAHHMQVRLSRNKCILKSLATPISPTTTNAEGRDNHFQFVEERGTWFPN